MRGANFNIADSFASKGQPAKLYFMGHVLMEHRLGLPTDAEFTEANGFAEREDYIRLMSNI